MTDLAPLLARIAEALERLAPAPPPEPDFSVGALFHYEAPTGGFAPAPDSAIALDLLVAIDAQKAAVVEALRRFATGLPSNAVLLWGARGTGKSSLVKGAATAQARATPSFKLVEIDRDALPALPDLFARLRGRPERFAVLCDDLSFEEGASAAKTLKSALEGGVAGPPPNVLFVATSNRRHLAPRSHDEARGLLEANEDAEEVVSVSDRFGQWIGFPPLDQAAYLAAVHAYATRFELAAPDLDRRALQWAQRRGGRSGRVALQFARELAGELGRALPL